MREEPAGVNNRRGLFYNESSDLHEDDEMVVQRALHGENGPINADELERRLDEELRRSKEFSFPVCCAHSAPQMADTTLDREDDGTQ